MIMTYYGINQKPNSLKHHQVRFAKWGVMHGPPYPLSGENKAKAKADYKKNRKENSKADRKTDTRRYKNERIDPKISEGDLRQKRYNEAANKTTSMTNGQLAYYEDLFDNASKLKKSSIKTSAAIAAGSVAAGVLLANPLVGGTTAVTILLTGSREATRNYEATIKSANDYVSTVLERMTRDTEYKGLSVPERNTYNAAIDVINESYKNKKY